MKPVREEKTIFTKNWKKKMINKLSGTFTVTKVVKPTIRKGFKDLQELDVFKISMNIQRHNFGGRKHAVDCEVIINGNSYSYSLNEVNMILRDVINVEQIN